MSCTQPPLAQSLTPHVAPEHCQEVSLNIELEISLSTTRCTVPQKMLLVYNCVIE